MADLATQLHDDPDKYVNDANVEVAWAMKAVESASIHMNLLIAVHSTKSLKLNRRQDEVYARFREVFPAMDVEKITEGDLKGHNKEAWRQFCEEFKDSVAEYNLGTMMRMDASGIYDEPNTLVAPKIIFLAIEGARNVEGINEKWKPKFSEDHRKAHADADRNVI